MLSYIIGTMIAMAALWSSMKLFFPWLAYDMAFFFGFGSRAISTVKAYAKMDPVFTLTSRLIERAIEQEERPFIMYEDKNYSHKDIDDRSNQIARALRSAGVKANETIGIMMTNSPTLVSVWFGINKAGAVPAFINYNLRSSTLLHCLKAGECSRLIISDEDFILKAIRDEEENLLNMQMKIYVAGKAPNSNVMQYLSLEEMSDNETTADTPVEWVRHITMGSHFCYMFTSGTTGPPKAAIISHYRAWMGAKVFGFARVTFEDVVYTTLPLYHGSAAIFGLLGSLEIGCTLVLRKKFSASVFWDDCRKYNVTVIQYIGEMLRYVCNQPEKLNDKHHNVRMGFGNGLAPGVWDKFLQRFGKNITLAEFYAATEGNIGYYNVTGARHRVGLSSPLYHFICGVSFVKYDYVNDVPIRDSNGRCIKTALGEPGLLIGKITKRTPFLGYRGNRSLTDKKILRDVFKPGDEYFNTGDMMLRHPDYTVSFVDRVGDTFRWKGENVSTVEVADIMSKAPGLSQVNVYGVKIPGSEGRAGMMVAVLKPSCEKLDCAGVYDHAFVSLPAYARPLFLRIQSSLQLTGTCKLIKSHLVREGFDLSKTGHDPIYYMDSQTESYVPLTQDIFNSIKEGSVSL
ncbi:long-chain fatty acid transport protein 2-like [Styela clava]